jgi:hypothetical protein
VRTFLVAVAALVALTPLGAQRGAAPPPQAPDRLLDNASFESGFDGFTNWTGAGTPLGVTRDSLLAADGRWSIKRTWTPNPTSDGGSQLLYKYSDGADRVWLRFYFRLTAPITTIMKFARFYGTNMNPNLGGLFIESGDGILGWGWDQENQALVMSIGLHESDVIDGRWHSIEVDYWRNGDPSGQPSAEFWFDDKHQGLPDGACYGTACWRNGRLYAGTRANSTGLSYMEWLGTLNRGNTTTGQVNIDKVSYSTKGRIGP